MNRQEQVGRIARVFFGDLRYIKLCEQAILKALREVPPPRDLVNVPRRFLEEFRRALDFKGGHGTPAFDRAYAYTLDTEAEKILLARAQPAPWSTGWAIQHADGLRWRTMDTIGMPDWTNDPQKALVCRLREHVERYAEDDPDDIRIVEVEW